MLLLVRGRTETLAFQPGQQGQRLSAPQAGAFRALAPRRIPALLFMRLGMLLAAEPAVQTQDLLRKNLLTMAAPACATLSHGYCFFRPED
jgi:hypothetical protein